MIKKILGLFVVGIGLFNFVYGANNLPGYTRQIGVYGYNPYYNSYDLLVSSNGTPFTDSLGDEKKIFSLFTDNYITYHAWFWYDGLPYVYYNYRGVITQGYIKNYYICDELVGNETTKPGNCITYTVDENTKQVFSSFVSSLTNNDYYFFRQLYDYNRGQFCFSSSSIGNSLCFDLYSQGVSLSNELNLPVYNFSSFDINVLQNSPAGSSGGGGSGTGDVEYGTGAIIIGSEESAINYFETYYGRDEKICYAGVDNLTDLFGTNGVSFQEGTGLNIFQVYSGTYGTPELNRVYVWLNSQLINYNQWFNNDGGSLFLSNYNSGTNQVDIYYDNLTFPFSGKPVAYYFLVSNIFDYSNPTEGSKIVSYCNLKINGGSFDDIIDQSVKNNINNYTEQSNKNNGLNPDGTQKIIDFSGFGSYTGDAWVSSGIDIDFSGDTTLKSSIRSFFERIDVLFGDTIETENNNRKGGLRSVGSILPSYIVYGLLFVVLFKLLKRR